MVQFVNEYIYPFMPLMFYIIVVLSILLKSGRQSLKRRACSSYDCLYLLSSDKEVSCSIRDSCFPQCCETKEACQNSQQKLSADEINYRKILYSRNKLIITNIIAVLSILITAIIAISKG